MDEPIQPRWESVGPFHEYRVVVNGWRVPLIEARELDGGKVSIVLDNRLGYVCENIAEANRLIPFLADLIGVCWGYGAHPMPDAFYDDNDFDNPFEKGPQQAAAFARVPHPSLAPHRVVEIGEVRTDESPDSGEHGNG